MLNEVASIVASFEELGMSPEEISMDRGLDIVAVKAALAQNSKKYKLAVAPSANPEEQKDPTLDFSDDDLRAANDVIAHTMKHGEDEQLKFKAACYIRDDKKGRKEVIKAIGGTQFNLFQFNENLRAARAGADRLKGGFLDVVASAS